MTSTRTHDEGVEPGRKLSPEAGHGNTLHQHPQPRSLQRAAAPASLVIAAAWCWRILVVAVTVLGLILLAARFYLPVLPFIFALLLAALLHPLHVGMRQLRLPRALATWATVMVALLVMAGVGWFVWTRAASSYTQLIAQVDSLSSQMRGYVGRVTGSNTMQLAQLQNSAVSWLQQHSNTVIGGALSFGTVLGELVTGLIVTLFLTFYFLEAGDRIWSWVVRLFPQNVQPSVNGAGYRSWHALSGWVVGTALIALFHGVVVGFTLFFLNVPLAFALAVLVFIGSFIPIIGSFVFGGLAVLVTLVSQGLVPALVVLAVLVIDSQIEAHLLQPFVVGRAVALHPVAIVLALTAGGVVGGIFGAIIVIPIVAAVHAAVKYLTGVEDLNGNPRRVDADRMAPEPPPQYAPLPLYASAVVAAEAARRAGEEQSKQNDRPGPNEKTTKPSAASEPGPPKGHGAPPA
ncbi:MAG: AI-2E family transporter [Humibacillus sp.]|nr:AI-2E family transporter [Humibacillus sp.]